MKDKPEMDLEFVKDLEVEGINFSISYKKLINCKFISCNILYGGGPLHLDGCEFGHCTFVRIGPIEDAFNNVDAEEIKRNLIKGWDDLKFLWEPKEGVDDKGNINLGNTKEFDLIPLKQKGEFHMTNVGGNQFKNVTFPLVFEDHYFMMEDSPEKDLWTVLQVKDGNLIIEVLKNEPQQNASTEVTTNPTGIITVSDKDSGKFLYKIRPGHKNSSIFGSINGEDTEIKITDKEIRVGTNSFQNNTVINAGVGVMVDKNGGMGLGGGLPPEIEGLISG